MWTHAHISWDIVQVEKVLNKFISSVWHLNKQGNSPHYISHRVYELMIQILRKIFMLQTWLQWSN